MFQGAFLPKVLCLLGPVFPRSCVPSSIFCEQTLPPYCLKVKTITLNQGTQDLGNILLWEHMACFHNVPNVWGRPDHGKMGITPCTPCDEGTQEGV